MACLPGHRLQHRLCRLQRRCVLPPSSAPKPKANAPATAEGHCTHAAAELSEGQRINHPNFGLGIIRRIDTSMADDRVVVEFSATGTRRTLLLKFARFTILSRIRPTSLLLTL